MKFLYLVPLFLAGFFVVHLLKMMRFYLVLLEQKLSIKKFVNLYIRTTFVNLLIPFKLGEVYRAFCVVKLTDCAEIGILSVILDRFFDTFILLLFLLPYDFLALHKITWLTGCMLVFLLAVMLVYRMFEPTYLYLNRYMIRKSKGRRGVKILSIMETVREWYDYTKDLITGRQYLIVICSALGWLTEYGLLQVISGFYERSFGLSDFSAYIHSIFTSGQSQILVVYSLISMLILLLLMIVFKAAELLRRKINEKKDSCSV